MRKKKSQFSGNVRRTAALALAGILAVMPDVNVMASEAVPDSGRKGEETEAVLSEEGSGNYKDTEEEIVSVEDANLTMASYNDEEAEWEEICIDSVEELREFARNCWLDTWSVNKKVYLTNDLNLSGSNFTSIPTFGGYFDGQGHTISGLTIRNSISYTGLFCYTQESAVIANLKVQGNVRPSGRPMVVGGIVGDNSGIMIRCAFEGNVEGNDYVGGVTGFNERSGILIDCSSSGKVTGAHYTGGIVGENTGNISSCVNEADVNTSNEDKAVSLEDINLEQYAAGLLDAESGDGKPDSASAINNTIDSGGIAGLSTGVIQYCENSGTIGYEHVGYNIGGIVGRQSGYVYSCENSGSVYGRKDVGGIAGQTEPYIAIDLSEDIAYQLSENIDQLHDLTGRMLDDAGTESDTVSARLTMIQDFVDKALDDTGFLADQTIEWTDGLAGSANSLMGRVDYIMDEAAKNGGFLDRTRNAAGDVRDAAREFGNTVEALDIYRYMSAEERVRYDTAKEAMESASEAYAKDYADVVEAYRNYYIDHLRQDSAYGRSAGFSLYVNTGNAGDGTEEGSTGSRTGGSSAADDRDGTADRKAGDDPAGSMDEGNEGNNNAGKTDSAGGEEEGKDTTGDTDKNKAEGDEDADNTDTNTADHTGGGSSSGVNDGAAGGSAENTSSADRINESAADDNIDDINAFDAGDAGGATVKDLKPRRTGGMVDETWPQTPKAGYMDYMDVEGWVHCHADGTRTDFPQSSGEQGELDRRLLADVADKMAETAVRAQIEADAAGYADGRYMAVHPGSSGYQQDMRDHLQTMSDIALKAGAGMSEEVRVKLGSAAGEVEDAMENLESAGSAARSIFDTVNGMEDLQMPQLGSDYRSRAGSLNSNLKGLSENMGHLNDEMSSTNDTMLADLSDINDQFSKIMRLYTDAIDGVLDMDYSTVYEDNSQEDAETSTDATIAGCTNRGAVQGDLNISGIAGTMAIEYDFDLEGDVTGIENARLNSTFLTKCVLRQNSNEGNITAQKSYVGGIAGLQEMGTILRCENYGRINSTAGNYVGGIAGQSLSYITNGYAKCTVSGEEHVAGIAGYGSSMENCCAMVRVQDAAAFYGAIAGETDSSGTVSGNYFVSDELAGIDRISYSGKAEPVSYEGLLATEGLPDRFRMMSVSFYADNEEVKRVECPYGGDVLQDMYPDIPVKDGFYADWDIREIRNILYDEDVTAEYVRYLTTLASGQTRGNGQSVLLADGLFKQEAALEAAGGSIDEIDGPDAGSARTELDAAEYWHVIVPEDGNEKHQLRYQAPEGQTDGVKIYIKQGTEWQQAGIELMGIYHLFMIEGTEADIAVCIQERDITDYLLYIVLAAAAVLIVVILVVRKKNQKISITNR